MSGRPTTPARGSTPQKLPQPVSLWMGKHLCARRQRALDRWQRAFSESIYRSISTCERRDAKGARIIEVSVE